MHNREKIGSHIVDYFTRLFSATPSHFPHGLDDLIPKVITAKDNTRLQRIPDETEIWAAVQSLRRIKAPEPDRFTALFYQRFWPQIKLK
ncbi:hypothetical protein CJ030_MR1G002459 [Morella rubra]|uniref:Uncharacterized protein n=1 Tax=Morella rubra TaxID=262757 RepID=A0A6A1WRZ5_9ROSI|nr:hypothetical protein CJ030_MR1G002459 [Morella rubra]